MSYIEMLNSLLNGGSYEYAGEGHRFHVRRRTEDDNVEYWRQQAGWYTDDETVAKYNSKVQNTSGSYSVYSGGNSGRSVSPTYTQLSTGLKITAAVISIVAAIVVFRVLSRRSSKKKSSSSSKGASDSRSHRSRSRSRSGRSRSRTRRSGHSSSNYELMDDKSDSRSRKSGRSRSRSRRSRSKSRSSKTRSKSKTRSSRPQEQVLV